MGLMNDYAAATFEDIARAEISEWNKAELKKGKSRCFTHCFVKIKLVENPEQKLSCNEIAERILRIMLECRYAIVRDNCETLEKIAIKLGALQSSQQHYVSRLQRLISASKDFFSFLPTFHDAVESGNAEQVRTGFEHYHSYSIEEEVICHELDLENHDYWKELAREKNEDELIDWLFGIGIIPGIIERSPLKISRHGKTANKILKVMKCYRPLSWRKLQERGNVTVRFKSAEKYFGLICPTRSIRIHRQFCALFAPELEELISQSIRESADGKACVIDPNINTCISVIRFIYRSKIILTENNFFELIRLADKFKAANLKEALLRKISTSKEARTQFLSEKNLAAFLTQNSDVALANLLCGMFLSDSSNFQRGFLKRLGKHLSELDLQIASWVELKHLKEIANHCPNLEKLILPNTFRLNLIGLQNCCEGHALLTVYVGKINADPSKLKEMQQILGSVDKEIKNLIGDPGGKADYIDEKLIKPTRTIANFLTGENWKCAEYVKDYLIFLEEQLQCLVSNNFSHDIWDDHLYKCYLILQNVKKAIDKDVFF